MEVPIRRCSLLLGGGVLMLSRSCCVTEHNFIEVTGETFFREVEVILVKGGHYFLDQNTHTHSQKTETFPQDLAAMTGPTFLAVLLK